MTPFEQIELHQIREISADTESACRFQSLLVVGEVDAVSGLFEPAKTSHGEVPSIYALVLEFYVHIGGLDVFANFDFHVLGGT